MSRIEPSRRTWRVLAVAQALLLVISLLAPVAALGAISTDQADYAPGSVVTISGDNGDGAAYLAGETVSVAVVGPNGYEAACEAVADDAGSWSCQVVLWDSELAVGEYLYTATGHTSGVTETGTFTDAIQTTTTVTSSLNPSNVGDSVTFTATVKSGNPANTTVTLGQVKFGTGNNCAGGFTELQPAMYVDSNGQVTFTTSSLSSGTTTIRACYLGSGTGSSALQASTGTVDQVVTAPADASPPVITPSVTGTLGANGWYTSNVTVSWAVTDPESSISSTTGCGSTTITTDTTGTTLTCTATSAGGTASQSVTIKRDATAPTITFVSRSPAANSYGWNNGDVTVTWSCTDATSGPVASPVSQTVSTEGASQSATGTCTDNAGNTASDTQGGINIDLTPPTLTWSGGIADGDSFYFGSVPASPTCTAADVLSGPDGCTVTGYETTVGLHELTATAHDKAGNEYKETRKYTVLAWTLTGFYRPVDMGDMLNTVKGGSTVPLKFEIFAGTTELTSVSAVKGFKAVSINCASLGDLQLDAIEMTTTGGTSLRYDSIDGQFIQNWQTPKQPGVCYAVTMTAQDGSMLTALFKLK